jgi:hypothetical protein
MHRHPEYIINHKDRARRQPPPRNPRLRQKELHYPNQGRQKQLHLHLPTMTGKLKKKALAEDETM